MTTINVANLSDLYDALANAQGGDVIELAGGNYGEMILRAKNGIDPSFASNVTIISADPENPAVFSGLDIKDAANLTFDGITFDYTFQTGDNIYLRPFDIVSSAGITIQNSTFDGDVASGVSDIDDGYGYTIGLSFRKSSDITVSNNEIFNFHRGLTTDQVDGLTVQGNDVHDIRSDGMNFSEVTDVLIENNYLHDFRASENSSDHRDMIQFWTNNTEVASSDITIRGNHLDIGEGTYTQSIFMRNDQVDQGLAGKEMFYKNITIEDNVIVNAHLHGITVGETDGLTIQGNTVLHDDGSASDGLDAKVEIPRIAVAENSQNVIIEQNATSSVVGHSNQSSWSVRNNALIQDQDETAPGYYNDVFLASSLQMTDGVHDFRALPGGMLDILDAGASSTLDSFRTENLTAQFHVEQNDDSAALRHFDASFTSSQEGDLPAGTTFTWDFGDGTSATGEKVDHAFANGGVYDVTLTAQLPDGTTDTRAIAVDVAGTQLVSYTNASTLLGRNGSTAVESSLTSDSNGGIELGGTGVATQISRAEVSPILTANEFSIDMTLTADHAASMGEIMRLHGSFVTSVTEAGEVHLLAFTDEGARIRMTTEGAGIKDAKAHDINISLKDGVLSLSVDGGRAASVEIGSTLTSSGTQDLLFGNPWNGQNFEGSLSQLSITVNESHFSGTPTTTATIAGAPLEETHYAPLNEHDGAFSTATADPIDILMELAARDLEQNTITNSVQDIPQVNLSKVGVSAQIAREEIIDILKEDAFSISMTLTADNASSAGEILRLHQSFVANVDQDGELYLQAFSEDGTRHRLTTEGADLMDMAAHDITISSADGLLSIDVDGVTLAQTNMSGPLASKGKHDLAFGNPWGKANFDGTVSGFEISVLEDTNGQDSYRPQAASSFDVDDAFADNIFAEASQSSVENSPAYNALETAHIWAEKGYLTPEALDRFETMLTTSTDAYFE